MQDTVEHLAEMVSELLARRSTMNVPSYMRATYLAALYAEVALHLEKPPSRRLEAKSVDWLGRLCSMESIHSHTARLRQIVPTCEREQPICCRHGRPPRRSSRRAGALASLSR